MWDLIIEGSILVLDLVYHRLTAQDAPRPPSEKSIGIPLIAEGTSFPLVYGKVRVKSPILAWTGKPYSIFAPADNLIYPNQTPEYFYAMSMHFVLGIPFTDDGVSRVHTMYVGDQRVAYSASWPARLHDLIGDGGFEPNTTRVVLNMLYTDTTTPSGDNFNPDMLVFGDVEFLNGKATQQLIADDGTPLTYLGQYMTTTTSAYPQPEQNLSGTMDHLGTTDYRGYLSVFLFCKDGAEVVAHWFVGPTATVTAYSFECSSYINSLDASRWPATYVYSVIGEDSNPMNVLYDLLVTYFAKLGFDRSRIDMVSFNAAAITLSQEGHGYSRCFDEQSSAQQMIAEILAQIDAALYEDPLTGLLGIKLIRPDYDPTTIPVIDKSNCSSLDRLELGGWTSIPNRVRVTFTDRSQDYRDGQAMATNQANAVGQDGQIREIQLRMPGVTTQALADQLAERELAARSRPTMKCTAIVDRSFYRAKPGDAVKIVMSDPDISGVVMRVASVNRGTLTDGRIQLDLISDYYYVWRQRPPVRTGFGGHVGGVLLPSG